MHSSFFKKQKGFTLIETLIAVAFVVGVVVAMYGVWTSIIRLNRALQVKEIVIALANEQFEIVRNMPYADVGTTSGIPTGTLLAQEDYVREGHTFRVNRYIRNIDDPADGTLGGEPDDASPADHKLIEVKIRCQTCETYIFETFTTTLAPKGLETSSGNGALRVVVIDADGEPVSGAEVSIDNYTAIPNIVIRDQTGVDGTLTVVDAPPYTQAYEVRIDHLSNFSTDQTYDSTDLGGSTPVLPHATVVEGVLSQITLSIDRLGSANITSVDTACTAIPNFNYNLKGSKLIGTTPDVFRYDEDLSTDAGGADTVDDLVWDTYEITSADGSYEIIGANPLLDFLIEPNQSQDIELIVAAKDTPTALITVKDVNGLPVEDADVTLTQTSGGSNVYTDTTYRGSFSQTDWSGGTGQTDYIDETQYYARNDVSHSSSGLLRLRSSSGSFVTNGYAISSTFDTGSPSSYGDITWLPSSQPVETGADSLKFQIATNNDNTTWNYVGPDGTSSTYYTSATPALGPHHDNMRYIRYKAYLSTANTVYTPSVTDVGIAHTSTCTPSGQVSFQNMSTGNYTVSVEKSGYVTTQAAITVSSGSWQNVEIILNEG